MKALWTAVWLLGLCACAARQADHFYVLNPQPEGNGATRTTTPTQASLRVTLPSLVDRPELVVNTSADGVTVLEHERWAAPLGDLVTQTLARDIERRRNDLLVSGSANRSVDAGIGISVEVVQVTVHRGQQASIEAHWRIKDASGATRELGGEVFSAPLNQENYAAIAQSLSQCLGLLADRLAAQAR